MAISKGNNAEQPFWLIIDRLPGGKLANLASKEATGGGINIRGLEMAEVEITDALEVISADPARRGRRDLMVSYTVDGARFYLLTIPIEHVLTADEKIDPPKVMAKIKEAEAERGKLIGQKFKL